MNTRMSTSPLYHSTAGFARKHSRVSLIAAGAAAAGMITAATATAGVALASGPAQTAGHSTATAFDAAGVLNLAAHNITSVGAVPTTDGHGDQLMSLRSAGTGGSTSPNAAAETPAAFLGHAAASHATAHQAAKPAVVHPVAKTVAAVKPKPVAKPRPVPQPYNLYDSVTPSALPAGEPAAVYANGSYAVSPSEVTGHRTVLWIDTNGSDPKANVLDVEPGDATPYGAAQWVKEKLTAEPSSIAVVYTMMSDWSQVKANVAALPVSMQRHVQYWIADPTGYPHIVPGSSATQWYWGSSIDISSARPSLTQVG
jgi:hypothetical protein